MCRCQFERINTLLQWNINAWIVHKAHRMSREESTGLSRRVLIPDKPHRKILHRLLEVVKNCNGDDEGVASFCERPTCQIELVMNADDNPWSIISLDENGIRKSRGGDEFYVSYEEYDDFGKAERLHCQAVAIIDDHEDGTYQLNFVTTPINPSLPTNDFSVERRRAVLTIHLEYTNGIGKLPPPSKATWEDGGYSHTCFQSNIDYRPPIRRFEAPPCTIDLGSFDGVYFFGDSTADQFVRQRPNVKGKYYFQPKMLVGEKIRHPLNTRTLQSMLELLDKEFGNTLRYHLEKAHRICLVLNSCLWDILDASDELQGCSFDDHIEACRQLITTVRSVYEGVKVAWKSPMAVHIHWVNLERLIEHDNATATLFGRDRVRYMSRSRSQLIFNRQQELMNELNVPMLDIYEASQLSADQLYPSDGRHYRPDLNRLMLGWFVPNATNETKYYQNHTPWMN